MRPGSHVLVPRPMKFFAGFGDPFLHIHRPTGLAAFPFDAPSPLGGPFSLRGHLVTVVIQPSS